MFQERGIAEPIQWPMGMATEMLQISEITPGSTVRLQTDEGDSVRVNVTKNDAGNFVGSIVEIKPDPPRSKRLADLGADADVEFGEANLIHVFSIPTQPNQ